MPTTDTRRSWWCRLGLHRWHAVTFREAPWMDGRRCRRCGKVQGYFFPGWWPGWFDTVFIPNQDSNGYY